MTDVFVSAEAVEEVKPAGAPDALDDQLIGQLLDRAKADGIKLTGQGGLLQQLSGGEAAEVPTQTAAHVFVVKR
ncbi:hypothetical protein SAMN02787118_1377 [Streptomyces mirabilis]|jgi:hypothetical protein|uniref:Uncharacterized protein n=1 Tax=Streptomyces mirabilis TaxID=68239 RepID=A0A1I2WF31_9ACTN|nr:transposase [Streptomyces mirabilis]SFG99915.1 hypothetical protein SAMN02787118_1377 [Streptomyces mirabilis]